MEATDFGNSYKTRTAPPNLEDKRVPGHKPWTNTARILLDARCVLTDAASGQSDEFFLIAPCRTEWCHQEENLFQVPSAEYQEIWSRDRHLSVGRRLTHDGELPRSDPVKPRFTFLEFTVRKHPETTVLKSDEDVVQATMQHLPLVVQTEIWSEDERMRALIEYPIKTINVQLERKRFQVDTGPVLVPDFTSQAEHWIDWFSLAHVAYNTFDRTEFIVRQPTPVVKGGNEVAAVLHYSEVRVYEARHTILCAGHL